MIEKNNIIFGIPDKKRPRIGDIFIISFRNMKPIYGMVVFDRVNVGMFQNQIMIYVYRTKVNVKEGLPEAKPSDLLMPPYFTDSTAWRIGLFKNVGKKAIGDEDLLRQHCFYHPFWKKYFNEKGEEVPKIQDEEMIGRWSSAGYMILANAIYVSAKGGKPKKWDDSLNCGPPFIPGESGDPGDPGSGDPGSGSL